MEQKYEVTIVGVTPLLQNRFATATEGEIKTTKRKSNTTKENNVEDTVYKMPDGTIYQPSESIKQCLIEAGKAFKKGKPGLSKIFASFIVVTPEAIKMNPQEYTTDRRAVVIPSTKGRVMRNRAKFEEWSLTFDITILDDSEINQETLHDALDYSGHYIGIGDYRPQKKGMFGRFIVQNIKKAK